MGPISAITAGLNLGREFLSQRHERKVAKQTFKAKAELAQQNNDHTQTMTALEWQVAKASQESSTWKDEYALIIGTSFIPLIMCGTIYMAFTGDDRLLTGVVEGIKALQDLGLNVGYVIAVSIFTGLGVAAWNKL